MGRPQEHTSENVERSGISNTAELPLSLTSMTAVISGAIAARAWVRVEPRPPATTGGSARTVETDRPPQRSFALQYDRGQPQPCPTACGARRSRHHRRRAREPGQHRTGCSRRHDANRLGGRRRADLLIARSDTKHGSAFGRLSCDRDDLPQGRAVDPDVGGRYRPYQAHAGTERRARMPASSGGCRVRACQSWRRRPDGSTLDRLGADAVAAKLRASNCAPRARPPYPVHGDPLPAPTRSGSPHARWKCFALADRSTNAEPRYPAMTLSRSDEAPAHE